MTIGTAHAQQNLESGCCYWLPIQLASTQNWLAIRRVAFGNLKCRLQELECWSRLDSEIYSSTFSGVYGISNIEYRC